MNEEYKEKEQQRIDYIDCAKGVGILLVVIGHHLQDSDGVIKWIQSFHVPLFFIITGYLLVQQNRQTSVKAVINSGAKKLLYPYYAFGILLVVWWRLMGAITQAQPEEVIQNGLLFLTTYGYHALWFLPAMYIANVISKSYKWKNRWCLLIGAVAVGSALSYAIHSSTGIQGAWYYVAVYIGRIMLAITFIEIGRIIFLMTRKLSGAAEWAVCVISLIIVFAGYRENIIVSMAHARIGNPVVFYIVACAGSIAVLLLCRKLQGKYINRTLTFYGRNSLTVMAIHMDISVEIAWIILGVTGWNDHLSFQMASILVILFEIIFILPCMITIINRYGRFLIQMPQIMRK